MLGAAPAGLELQHRELAVWLLHQTVDGAAHDAIVHRERERDLMEGRSRQIQRAQLRMRRERAVGRRRAADDRLAIRNRDRLLDANE